MAIFSNSHSCLTASENPVFGRNNLSNGEKVKKAFSAPAFILLKLNITVLRFLHALKAYSPN